MTNQMNELDHVVLGTLLRNIDKFLKRCKGSNNTKDFCSTLRKQVSILKKLEEARRDADRAEHVRRRGADAEVDPRRDQRRRTGGRCGGLHAGRLE